MASPIYEFRDGLLVHRNGHEVCIKKITKVANVATAVQDLDEYTSIRYIRAYISAFNLGFPIEFYSIVRPVDRNVFAKNLEKVIAEGSLIYEVNPLKSDTKIRIERAKLLRNRVLKDSLQPYETEVYIVISACGDDIGAALEAVEIRARILRNTLLTLGIEVEDVDAEKVLPKILFTGSSLRNPNPFARFLDKLRRKLVLVDFVSIPIFTFIPLLGRTKATLRSTGIKLGVDVESSEEVYWNLEEVTSPHILVVGPSGIGKTTFLANISIALSRAGLGVLVLDPKNEYRKLFESYGKDATYFLLGRDVSMGLAEVVKSISSSLEREVAEVLLDVLSTHRELGRRDIFPCLYTAISNINTSMEGGDLTLIDAIKRLSRYCSDEYSEYVINKTLSILSNFSNSNRGLLSILRDCREICVVDVSTALSIDSFILPLILKVISIGIKTLSSKSQSKSIYRRVLVVDEAWGILRNNSSRHLEELLRLGRSFGVIVALATQTIKDLTKSLGPLVDNFGLLVALPSTNSDYWEEVGKLIKINHERVERVRSLGRGYALIRIAPDPRTTLIRLDLAPSR